MQSCLEQLHSHAALFAHARGGDAPHICQIVPEPHPRHSSTQAKPSAAQSITALTLHHDPAVAEAAMDVLLEYSTRKQGTAAGNRSDAGVAQAAAALFRMACRGSVRALLLLTVGVLAADHSALWRTCLVSGCCARRARQRWRLCSGST